MTAVATSKSGCVKKDGSKAAYASGLVMSDGRYNFTYGFVEARMWLPPGTGTPENWAAFWVNGKVWPEDGEIDIMERQGRRRRDLGRPRGRREDREQSPLLHPESRSQRQLPNQGALDAEDRLRAPLAVSTGCPGAGAHCLGPLIGLRHGCGIGGGERHGRGGVGGAMFTLPASRPASGGGSATLKQGRGSASPAPASALASVLVTMLTDASGGGMGGDRQMVGEVAPLSMLISRQGLNTVSQRVCETAMLARAEVTNKRRRARMASRSDLSRALTGLAPGQSACRSRTLAPRPCWR
ncbi:MAG: family 16 glycosylhydrolase [Myxococcales bacterium]|nr:family 16 glycosylhydrolase [Myxococcales bacterium]